MIIVKRSIILCLVTVLWYSFACNGGGSKSSLEARLLDYNEVDLVTFSISGNAVCSKCEEDEVPIDMMQLEVYQKDNPIDRLALKIYGGLGAFSLINLRAPAGSTVEVQGKLYRQGASGNYITAYYGYGEVTTPDDDDKNVAMTLKFPSSDNDN